MTPTIADTIVTAGGAEQMTKMKSAVGKSTSSAKTIALQEAGVHSAGSGGLHTRKSINVIIRKANHGRLFR